MSEWAVLGGLLDEAATRQAPVRFWWRDDDAGRPAPALDRLLDLAAQHEAPLALAVVPAWLEPAAQAAIAGSLRVSVLQHGFAHRNAAAPGAKPVELGGTRTAADLLAELRSGRALLEETFGALFVSILVPPWNRIEPALLGHLASAGYLGLSTFGRRAASEPAPGLRQINTHLDPIDWRGSRLFVGERAALAQLVRTLEGVAEPVGILTHHLDLDEAGWAFIDRLLGLLRRHPGALVCAAQDLLEGTQ